MQDNDVLILGEFSVLFFNVLHGHGALMRVNLVDFVIAFFMQFGNGKGFYFSKVVICCSLFVNYEGGALFILMGFWFQNKKRAM